MGEELYAQVIDPDKYGKPCRVYAPVGSHEDLGEELRSVGLAVVTVHAAEGMVTVKLEEIFRRRIEWARRLEGPVPTISGRTVESLVATYGTDVLPPEELISARAELLQGFQRVILWMLVQ